jgi:hypothetical protein
MTPIYRMDSTTKRPTSAWAKAVAEHIKKGGSFPKKGTADYDAVKKAADAMKTTTPAKQTPKDKEDEKLGAEVRGLKDKVKKVSPPADPPVDPVAPPPASVPEKKKRGPYKKKVVESEPKIVIKEEDVPAPVVEKKKRGPYKKKEKVAQVEHEEVRVEDHKTTMPEKNTATMTHKINISQTIPLARLNAGGKQTVPFSNFEVVKM